MLNNGVASRVEILLPPALGYLSSLSPVCSENNHLLRGNDLDDRFQDGYTLESEPRCRPEGCLCGCDMLVFTQDMLCLNDRTTEDHRSACECRGALCDQ